MSQYLYYTDPITGLRVRDGAGSGTRAGQYVIEKELISGGFALDLGAGEGEDTGWELIGGAI
jgi:hypothetical protein